MDLRITVFSEPQTELRQTLLLSCRTVKRRLDRSLVASLPINLVSPGSMYGRAVESWLRSQAVILRRFAKLRVQVDF
jgi:hypothetical protein